MMKRKNTDVRENPKYEKHDKGQGSTYFGDTKLIPRIQQYLASHKSKQLVHISTLSDDLQARYNEYGRKKKNAFRKSVEKAYEYILLQQKDSAAATNTLTPDRKHIEKRRKTNPESSDGSESDSSASFSDDNTEYKVYEPRNTMNSFMTDLYKKTPNSSRNNTPANSRPGTPTKNLSCGTSPAAKEKKGTPVTFTIDRKGDPSLKTTTGKDVSQARSIGLSEFKSKVAVAESPHKNKLLADIQEDSELSPSSSSEKMLGEEAEATEIKSTEPVESVSQPLPNELLSTKSTKPAAHKTASSTETGKTPNAKVKKKKVPTATLR